MSLKMLFCDKTHPASHSPIPHFRSPLTACATKTNESGQSGHHSEGSPSPNSRRRQYFRYRLSAVLSKTRTQSTAKCPVPLLRRDRLERRHGSVATPASLDNSPGRLRRGTATYSTMPAERVAPPRSVVDRGRNQSAESIGLGSPPIESTPRCSAGRFVDARFPGVNARGYYLRSTPLVYELPETIAPHRRAAGLLPLPPFARIATNDPRGR
jgi:hypothetical protein